MNRMRMAVVGVGHLGKEHARILSASARRGTRRRGRRQPGPGRGRRPLPHDAFDSHYDLLDQVDAVAIVAPTLYHHPVARAFLERGVPVLVEKPVAATVAEADELVALARPRGPVPGRAHRAVQPGVRRTDHAGR